MVQVVPGSFISLNTPMSSLIDLIHSKSYEAVVERARAFPKEAADKNKDDITALHWVTYDNAPLNVVKAIYDAWPGALYVSNRHGNTPLDVAMKCASDEIIQFLQNPEEEQERRRLMSHLLHLRQEMHAVQNENARLFQQYHDLTITHNTNAATISSLQNELDASGCIIEEEGTRRSSGISEMTFDTFDLKSIESALSFVRDLDLDDDDDDDDDDTSKKKKTPNKIGRRFFFKNPLSLTRNSRVKSSGRSKSPPA